MPEICCSWAAGSTSERKSARKTEVVSGARSGGTPGPSFVVTSGLLRRRWCGGAYACGGVRLCGGQPTVRDRCREAPVSRRSARGRRRRPADRPERPPAPRMSIIQPSSYGPELISSGVSARASLTATTVPRQRCVDVGDRLGRLHLADRRAGGDRVADRRQLDEDDVAELGLGVIGDADPHHPVRPARAPIRGQWCSAGPRGSRQQTSGPGPADPRRPGLRMASTNWARYSTPE